jgi:hypothetical protein
MTDDTRGAIIDLAVLGVAAVAVYLVVKTPALRRPTSRLLKYALFSAAPTYLWHETMRAWAESGTRNRELGTGNREPRVAIIDA